MIHDSSLLRCTVRLAGRSLFEDAARNPVSTAVAVAQALLWFFALPAVMKPYWPHCTTAWFLPAIHLPAPTSIKLEDVLKGAAAPTPLAGAKCTLDMFLPTESATNYLWHLC